MSRKINHLKLSFNPQQCHLPTIFFPAGSGWDLQVGVEPPALCIHSVVSTWYWDSFYSYFTCSLTCTRSFILFV